MDSFLFGQYLVQLRNERSISQRKLAELAGLTNSTISRIEANLVNPDPTTLEKIAMALDVDKSLLFTKCGYSEIPEEFVILARKTEQLSHEKKLEAFDYFNKTVDKFLAAIEGEEV